MAIIAALCAAPALAQTAPIPNHFYDLGGPCENKPLGDLSEAIKAAAARNWDRAIDLYRVSVRSECTARYRWYLLAETLAQAGRQDEAIAVLEEMDARGFDLNPSLLPSLDSGIAKAMETTAFQNSAAGLKIQQLRKISDERRATLRAMLAALPANQRPPENYVAKGSCPFECCHYGEWIVARETTLVAEPGSTQVVGTAVKGTNVTGVTGELHLHPQPVYELLEGDIPHDTIAFLLDYEGEGFGGIYTQGRVLHTQEWRFLPYCFQPGENCRGEKILTDDELKPPVWWVMIKLPNGVVGWTDKPGNFSHIDLCAAVRTPVTPKREFYLA